MAIQTLTKGQVLTLTVDLEVVSDDGKKIVVLLPATLAGQDGTKTATIARSGLDYLAPILTTKVE